MRFEKSAIQKELATLPPRALACFAFLCAERLRPAVWAFESQAEHDLRIYFSGCERAYAWVAARLVPDRVDVERLIADLDGQIPRSDDFGYPLSVQAQGGIAALSYCLELLVGGDVSLATDAAVAVVDAVDNYEYAVRKSILGEGTCPSEHALLDRELEWQSTLVSTLREPECDVQQLRVLNRAFVVPPAV